MKTKVTSATCAWITFIVIGSSSAQVSPMPPTRIVVEARVLHPDGNPVDRATVRLSLSRYNPGETNWAAAAVTDTTGVARVAGLAQQDYLISVDKTGYYRTAGPHRTADLSPSGTPEVGIIGKIDIELRPIRNPITGISRNIERLSLPKIDVPMGFDLEVGDWVSPHGKGRHSDFIFELHGRFTSSWDYDQEFSIRFTGPLDGIAPIRHQTKGGSELKWPYEAPLVGYDPLRKWKLKWDRDRGHEGTSADLSGATNCIFRVRSKTDNHGNLVGALYGVISGDFVPVAGNSQIGRNVSFTYALNPDGDPQSRVRPRQDSVFASVECS